ncbi:unnamed protein product [Acidithrix sp. C25]|nr:unnamed protein product [Acidithrix sp. C25]
MSLNPWQSSRELGTNSFKLSVAFTSWLLLLPSSLRFGFYFGWGHDVKLDFGF